VTTRSGSAPFIAVAHTDGRLYAVTTNNRVNVARAPPPDVASAQEVNLPISTVTTVSVQQVRPSTVRRSKPNPSRRNIKSCPPNGGLLSCPPNGGSLTCPSSGGLLLCPPNVGLLPCPPNGGLLSSPPNGGVLTSPPNGGLLPCPPNGGFKPCPPTGGLNPCPPTGGCNSCSPTGDCLPLEEMLKSPLYSDDEQTSRSARAHYSRRPPQVSADNER
jgi:hypothetical protein